MRGKQIINNSVSLEKLDGNGSVSLNSGAIIEFLSGAKLYYVGTPSDATEIVNKGYVDSVSNSIVYISQWNPTTNTPTLTDDNVSEARNAYICTTVFTRFGIDWEKGDYLVYDVNGNIFKEDNPLLGIYSNDYNDLDNKPSIKEKLITVSLGDIGASNFEDDIPTKIKAYAISNSITRELNTLHKWKLTENPFYYAPNGVTVVLKEGFPAGSLGTVDGDNSGKIYTAVNETQLRAIINEGDANTDLTGFCTTLVTNMEGTISPSYQITPFINSGSNQDISSWDVSNVTTMRFMFMNTTSFNQPLNNWDVSSVNSIGNMFTSSIFNQPLNNWDVSNVTDMSGMFRDSIFNQPLNNWDVSNVTSMSSMFYNSSSFNQLLDNWDVSNVTLFNNMFNGALLFNQSINNWNLSSATTIGGMFMNTTSFNQPLNNWDVSNVTTIGGMFNGTTAFNQPLNNWDVSNVTFMDQMFINAEAFNQDLSGWCVTNIASEPNNFDTGADAWVLANSRPIWGTCP